MNQGIVYPASSSFFAVPMCRYDPVYPWPALPWILQVLGPVDEIRAVLVADALA